MNTNTYFKIINNGRESSIVGIHEGEEFEITGNIQDNPQSGNPEFIDDEYNNVLEFIADDVQYRLNRGLYTLQPILVTLDGEKTFNAYWTGELWNGFICPYFEFTEAVKVAEYVNSVNEGGESLIIDGGKIYENIPNGQMWETQQIDGITVIALGAWGWCWETEEE